MSYTILNTIGQVFTDEAKTILSQAGRVDYFNGTQKELEVCIADYDILLVGLGLRIDQSVLERAKKLKLIATATTGLDHLDVALAQKMGVEVISLRGETDFLNSITGTAELAFGLMIDLMRGISAGFASVKQYKWDRERFRGRALRGKVLGIVGLGRLGKMMARYGLTFGMKVLAYDPNPEVQFCQEIGVTAVDFTTLLKDSDIVSIHVPFNYETEQMFNEEAFIKMKPGAYLINTARGGIVDEKELLAALSQGKLAGYATDVLADEVQFSSQGFFSHPLVEYAKTHDNMIITPHLGGMTHESRAATDVFMARKVATWMAENF